MRLFTAIPLSLDIKEAIVACQQSLPKGVRKQPVEQMHITLRFLGETSRKTAENIKVELANIHAAPFTLTLKGAGTFPLKGKPKVIWAGVEKVKPLINLQKKIENVCVDAGFEPEKRTYTPHVTLGKVKKASALKVKRWVENMAEDTDLELRAEHFILYQSVFMGGGVNHKPMKEYVLESG